MTNSLPQKNEPATILLNLLQTEELQIEGWFTIVERDKIRQRPLP